jgi:hypothetical protein
VITEVKDVITEDKAYSGSMFATTRDGEGVFINARIVQMLDLAPMEEVRAFVLPNYPDKKDYIPWRAIRVERVVAQQAGVVSLEQSVDSRVLEVLKRGGIYTNGEIADELGEEAAAVGTATARLFALGKISKAEVYKRPGQARPSFLLYGIDVEQFE